MIKFYDENTINEENFSEFSDCYGFVLTGLTNNGNETKLSYIVDEPAKNLVYSISTYGRLFKDKKVFKNIFPAKKCEIKVSQTAYEFEKFFDEANFTTKTIPEGNAENDVKPEEIEEKKPKTDIVEVVCKLLENESFYTEKMSILKQIPTGLFENISAGKQILSALHVKDNKEKSEALEIVGNHLNAVKQYKAGIKSVGQVREKLLNDYETLAKK